MDFELPEGVTPLPPGSGSSWPSQRDVVIRPGMTLAEWWASLAPLERLSLLDISGLTPVEAYNIAAAGGDLYVYTGGSFWEGVGEFFDSAFGEHWYEFWGRLSIAVLGFGVGAAVAVSSIGVGAAIATSVGGLWGATLGLAVGTGLSWSLSQTALWAMSEEGTAWADARWNTLTPQGEWFMAGAYAGALIGAAGQGGKEAYDLIMGEIDKTIDQYKNWGQWIVQGALKWVSDFVIGPAPFGVVVDPVFYDSFGGPIIGSDDPWWWSWLTTPVSGDFTTNTFDLGGGW